MTQVVDGWTGGLWMNTDVNSVEAQSGILTGQHEEARDMASSEFTYKHVAFLFVSN